MIQMTRSQKIDYLRKMNVTDVHLDAKTDGYLDARIELIMEKLHEQSYPAGRHGDGRESRLDGGTTVHADAELAELLRRFDAALELPEAYAAADPWRNGPRAAYASALCSVGLAKRSSHGGARGSAVAPARGDGDDSLEAAMRQFNAALNFSENYAAADPWRNGAGAARNAAVAAFKADTEMPWVPVAASSHAGSNRETPPGTKAELQGKTTRKYALSMYFEPEELEAMSEEEASTIASLKPHEIEAVAAARRGSK